MGLKQSRAVRAVTRRTLIKGGAAGAFALVMPAAATAAKQRLESHLRRSSYRNLVGQGFRVKGANVSLRLTAVQNLNPHQADSEHAFALIFQAPSRARALGDALSTLHHPALGSFDFMLTPGTASAHGRVYAAIINRARA
jgi:Domain of unknown function (DUF6916)